MADKLLGHVLGSMPSIDIGSAGTSKWHVGEAMDPRAAQVLAKLGCDTRHTARRINKSDLESDLLIAMGEEHRETLVSKGADPSLVRLLAEFHPELANSASVPDPFRGTLREFHSVAELILNSLPLLVAEIKSLSAAILEN